MLMTDKLLNQYQGFNYEFDEHNTSCPIPVLKIGEDEYLVRLAEVRVFPSRISDNRIFNKKKIVPREGEEGKKSLDDLLGDKSLAERISANFEVVKLSHVFWDLSRQPNAERKVYLPYDSVRAYIHQTIADAAKSVSSKKKK